MPALTHRVVISDPNVTATNVPSGEQDDDTGAFSPEPSGAGDPKIVYDGSGRFLDQGVVVERDTAGLPTVRADGQVVLEKGAVADFGIKDDMLVTVEYENGETVDMSILRAIRFTDIIYVIRA